MKTNVHHWKSLLLIFLVTLFCLGNETLAQTAIFNNPISGTNITASPYDWAGDREWPKFHRYCQGTGLSSVLPITGIMQVDGPAVHRLVQ